VPDVTLYVFHALFWGTFLPRGLAALLRRRAPATEAPVYTARFSRTLVVIHSATFGVQYFGLGMAIFSETVPEYFAGQRILGAILILGGAALIAWTMMIFRSWRFRAELGRDHQLSTDGPFRIVRHPIYAAMDLYAIGTAVWVPTPLVIVGAVLVLVIGDIRARVEEKLLVSAFGDAYRGYCARVKRFLPGVY
jgi:protein-S-isoprenylcysteine O-methyltransferase Ste14